MMQFNQAVNVDFEYQGRLRSLKVILIVDPVVSKTIVYSAPVGWYVMVAAYHKPFYSV